MKMNVLVILTLVSSMLASVVTATYNLPQLDDSFSMANAFAQTPEVQEDTSSSNGIFQVSYTKLGVMSGAYQQILYDSGTNSLGITNTSAKSTT